MTVIQADTPAEPLKTIPDRLTNAVNSLTYSIQFAQAVKSGEPVNGIVHITSADGIGFTQLEPVMGAFAHIVGFHEDRTSALHIHPETARPSHPAIGAARICISGFTPRSRDFIGCCPGAALGRTRVCALCPECRQRDNAGRLGEYELPQNHADAIAGASPSAFCFPRLLRPSPAGTFFKAECRERFLRNRAGCGAADFGGCYSPS